MKTPIAFTFLFLTLVAAVHAASITSEGTLANLTPAGNGVGTDVADLDAQGVGTDGFIVFASFDEGLNKGGLAWNEGIIDNSPAYITPMAAGTAVASGGWANYDDVTIGGTTFNTGGITFGSGAGTEAALFAFELSGTIPDPFTVGLLTDNSDNTGWAANNIRIEGPGAISADQGLVPDGASDLLQFNISGGAAGDIFTVYGTSNGSGSLIGAATFDSGALDITDSTDTDGDNIGDNWEQFYFGGLEVIDGTVDSESDGLTDLEEWQEGTNPLQADTDADGLSDGDEVNANNPDGVVTNPLNADTDGDGLSDADEVQGNNPQNFTSNPTLGDTDSDQFDDAAEIASLTDPRDPDDFPSLLITAAGILANLTPVGNGVGTDVADLDAQGVGTDGFIVFASLPEGTNSGGMPWDGSIIDNSPAYITPLAAGSSTASGGWANYDDVTVGGTTYNTGGITFGSAAGTEAALFAFELSDAIPGSFTVGLLTDNSDNTGWAANNIRIEGPGAISADQDLVPDGGTDLLQFNISGAEAGEIFTVYGTSNGSGSLIGAATFDTNVIPEPFSITRVERTNDGLEIDFNSQSGRIYGVDVSIDLLIWLEVDDGVLATGPSTTFTVTDQALLSQRVLYCRVKEAP